MTYRADPETGCGLIIVVAVVAVIVLLVVWRLVS